MASSPSASPAPEIGRLQQTFTNTPLSTHPSKWDSLWKESYTPWDRGGPSLALGDLITSRSDLFPSGEKEGRKLKALVPGCGRGYDAVLLAGLGYDVVGLDYSSAAVELARKQERRMRDEGGLGEGEVTWVQGDFFDDAWLRQVGIQKGEFDVIFDYTVSLYQVYENMTLIS
jgi:SAM-dependent methyltransferase